MRPNPRSPYGHPLARFTSYPLAELVVAVDFDGTCVTHAYPKTGRDIGAEPVLQRLVDEGAKLLLWTMRSGRELDAAMDWFKERSLPLFAVNEHPEQRTWTASPKPLAHLYIDDSALGVPLIRGGDDERPYVDWPGVAKLIWPQPAMPQKHPEASGFARLRRLLCRDNAKSFTAS